MIDINSTFTFADGSVENIWNLRVDRGDIVEVVTPEGRSDDFVCYIRLTNAFDGIEFQLKHKFYGKTVYTDDDSYYVNGYSVAERFMEKILANGIVDLNNWVEVPEGK